MTFLVAIDGPAGTGKSSVARLVAQQKGFIYVDTGALYRGLAFLALKYGLKPDDYAGVVKLIDHMQVSIDEKTNSTKIIIDGDVLDQELRSEHISRASSVVSQDKKVRDKLLAVQRNLAGLIKTGAIFEGRDIGTVVFPKAPLKIFITANSKTRAKRRFDELSNHKGSADYQEILDAIEKRDERDKNRVTAPMQEAHDATVIDSSDMSLEQVINQTLELINHAQARPRKDSKLW